MTDLDAIEREIQAFTRSHLIVDEYVGDDPLADLTFDSLALEQLVSHLEETFRLLFDEEETSRANLSSTPRLARIVKDRLDRVERGQTSW